MEADYFIHPERDPKNVPGPFYTLCGECMACGAPEDQAPTLLSPLTDEGYDTYFVRQPGTAAEIEQACDAIQVCCVDALRYGGRDPAILERLGPTVCDYALPSWPPQNRDQPRSWSVEDDLLGAYVFFAALMLFGVGLWSGWLT